MEQRYERDDQKIDWLESENRRLRAELETAKRREVSPEFLHKLDAALLQNEEARKEILKYRRMLWVLARKDGLSITIDKKELELVPDEAELLTWYEPLFDAWYLKGICGPADCAPSIDRASVTEKRVVLAPNEHCKNGPKCAAYDCDCECQGCRKSMGCA
jgi:hypothetical protein